jgi:drug/metabolite transporter (DMT)-like permease
MFLTSLFSAEVVAVSKYVQQHVSPYEVVFFQSAVGLICTIPLLAVMEGWRGLATKCLGHHLVRDVSGILGYLLLFIALNYMSLTEATLLNSTGPLFVPFIFWVWLHERIPARLWWGIVIGFLGVVFILQPFQEAFHWQLILALGSGLGMGISFVAIRLLLRTEGPYVILFYYFLVGVIMTLPLAIWKWTPAASWLDWLYLLLVGLGTLGVQLTMVWAFQRGRASVLSPLIYLVLVWTTIIDWLVWKQVPNWLSWVGILLVVVGGILSLILRPPPPRVMQSVD